MTNNLSEPRQAGFTLIELMIVVAVIAILAAIAYPSYTQYIIKSRRAAAGGCLMEQAQFAERYYTTNMTYVGADTAMPALACISDTANFYRYGFSSGPAATTYGITATPQGAQAISDTKCGGLTINQAGAKSVGVTGTNASDCF